MKPRGMLRVSVLTSPEAEDAVSELLQSTLGAAATSYLDLESGRLSVSVYLDKPEAWSRQKRAALRQGLDRIRGSGLDPGPAMVRIAQLPARNWAEAWKRHFHPLEIGSELLLLPSWSKRQPRRGQQVIVLDPGLSFGTGHHPTTGYCLKELARAATSSLWRDEFHESLESPSNRASLKTRRELKDGVVRPKAPLSFLDLGCGSGILAIAAAKLGFSPVHAVEIDPDAVRIARANARQNGVAGKIRFECGDFRRFRPARPYSFICANLVSDLLVSERRRLLKMVAPAGNLVLAGILATEFKEVRRRFEEAGAVCLRSVKEREWCSGTFRRRR